MLQRFSLHRPRNGRASAGPRSAQWMGTNGGPTGEWSRRPSWNLAAVGYAASSTSSEGLVQWDPLHEPDQFIDGRKLLAKSGSSSRRHPMHGQHRHQLRSSTLQRYELSLDRRWPPAFDGGDHPPSLRKERTHKHLPPTTCRRTTGSATCLYESAGPLGRDEGSEYVVHRRNCGASFTCGEKGWWRSLLASKQLSEK